MKDFWPVFLLIGLFTTAVVSVIVKLSLMVAQEECRDQSSRKLQSPEPYD